MTVLKMTEPQHF